MLGFGAIGTGAIGSGPAQSAVIRYTLAASAGALTCACVAQTFAIAEAASVGGYVRTGFAQSFNGSVAASTAPGALTAVASSFALRETASSGLAAVSGVAAAFAVKQVAGYGACGLTGVATADVVMEPVAAGALVLSGGPVRHTIVWSLPAAACAWSLVAIGGETLVRTGGDTDQAYGGIGHVLLERARLNALDEITRPAPRPIVQPSQRRRFKPVGIQPEPSVRIAAMAAPQRIAEQSNACEAAIMKRRRQEAEVLLLAG